jgi:hypothetical protein
VVGLPPRIPPHHDHQPVVGLVKASNRGLVVTYDAHGAGVAITVDPVGAIVGIKVLAPVLVKSAAARHVECVELGPPLTNMLKLEPRVMELNKGVDCPLAVKR